MWTNTAITSCSLVDTVFLSWKEVLLLLLAVRNKYLNHYLHNCYTYVSWIPPVSSGILCPTIRSYVSVWFSYLSVLLTAFQGLAIENTMVLSEIKKKKLIYFKNSNQYCKFTLNFDLSWIFQLNKHIFQGNHWIQAIVLKKIRHQMGTHLNLNLDYLDYMFY